MKWVTREKVKIDRVACPWLIKKFIDPDAEFVFVPGDQVLAVAEREGGIPFHVPGTELRHYGNATTFEAFLKKYELTGDPALALLAKIVNAADMGGEQPEGAGLRAISDGFRYYNDADDETMLAAQLPLYDALYAYCQEMVRRGRPDGQFVKSSQVSKTVEV
jgi:hypothetical protein